MPPLISSLLLVVLCLPFLPAVSLPLSTRSAVCPVVLPVPGTSSTTRNLNSTLSPPTHSLSHPSRVINGDRSNAAHSLLLRGLRSQCTGVLIHPSYVLTAAHCLITTTSWRVIITRNGDASLIPLRTIFISSVLTHPDYVNEVKDVRGSAPDIAVLQLSSSITEIAPVRLNTDPAVPRNWSFARVIGFGKTAFGDPHTSPISTRNSVDLPVVPQEECEEAYEGITMESVCAGYLRSSKCSSCFGDSGGGLFVYTKDVKPVHIGIVSQGALCGNFPGNPTRFVRTSRFTSWLRDNSIPFTAATGDDVEEVYVVQSDSGGISGGAVGGIIVGVIIVLVVITVIALIVMRRNKQQPVSPSVVPGPSSGSFQAPPPVATNPPPPPATYQTQPAAYPAPPMAYTPPTAPPQI